MSKTTTFLLVEDDLNDVFSVEREFRSAPPHIRLRVLPDAVEAMHYLQGEGLYADRQNFPLPDVILLDLKMPRISGFEFLEWLRKESDPQHRLLPVIITSSSAFREDITRAYAIGVNSYLIKPVDWKEFRQRIGALGIYWTERAQTPVFLS